MNVMLDTNVIIDVLFDRMPFSESSSNVLWLCEQRSIEGFVSASSVTDIFYLVKRHTHSKERAHDALALLFRIARVADVTEQDVLAAFQARAKDFEDCLVAVCAQSALCDCIVTRNQGDFEGLAVPAVTPEELLERIAADT